MDGMTEEDFKEVSNFSIRLMSEADPKVMSQSLSKYDSNPVPEEWLERGVTFIRYDSNSVSFGWFGGPFGHTELLVKQVDEEALNFTAHYTDNEPQRLLRTIQKKPIL